MWYLEEKKNMSPPLCRTQLHRRRVRRSIYIYIERERRI